MKKTYQIEVDCANCANLMEEAAKKTEGVADAVVNFMTQKMTVEFAEGQRPQGRDEGRPEELQEGRGRLRDLSVRYLLPLTPRTNAPGRFLRQNSNSPLQGGHLHDEKAKKDALPHPDRGGAVPRARNSFPCRCSSPAVLYFAAYLTIGYDILRKAWKGICNRQVFDENFLMAVATDRCHRARHL